ncbi:MAG TPA: galactose oxidase-like domain-containing protein [Blastocatellia bacterium]|nr:galactose oxidase-like domain-containing protein [Blastocatellia bacterium]
MRYEIKGKVIDAGTGAGVAGVRVEAWDKDLGVDDYLGAAATISDGSFTIKFDEDEFRDLFLDQWPDIYFKIFCCDDLIASTEDSVLWNVKSPDLQVTIKVPPIKPAACVERHIYLKIERIEGYSPVHPQEHVVPPIQYGRDCMRNEGHENALIPQSEIDARRLDAVVYREYLDSGYLIPKPDKLILADINEPVYNHRVPGTVIYTRPCQRLKIHVWNDDEISHSLHAHGLRYGIDSDGSWPFGTEAAHHGGRSDAICPGGTWTYTFDVTDKMIGVWPFHDHTHHHDMRIDQGLFGGFVVLSPCDKPPRPFRFPKGMLDKIYAEIERSEGRPLFPKQEGKDDDHDDHHGPRILAPHAHVKRLKPASQRLLEDHIEFLEEFVARELSLQRRRIPTDHVPVFFHVMSSAESRPTFDSNELEALTGVFELTFATAGDHGYFCRIHPEMTGTVRVVAGGPATAVVNIVDGPPMSFSPADITIDIGGAVRWENHSMSRHTVTSQQGATMPTHCINGRGFTGNSPTIVGRAGQRLRWYVFNLDTSATWHNFHPHAMRWKFAGENIDIRSIGPAESFVVEAEFPPALLLTEEEERLQHPDCRPKEAKLYHFKGDFMFHCHVHHHMMNGMIGLARSKQSFWLTPDMAHEISHRTGLPLDDGSNACPKVDPHPCHAHDAGRWEEIAGAPEVTFMHSILLPNTKRVLYWGYTRADQSRVWDYSTAAGSYLPPANQPAALPGLDINTSDMWSAEHALLDTPEGLALIHGGFSPNRSFTFNPGTLMWAQVANTAHDRFYSTTLTIGDGRALTLFGSASKSIEAYTQGAGWAAPLAMPAPMHHHVYYPWTYLLPDGRLFIAGPHMPTQRFDFNAPAGAESFPTIGGDRSTGGEKGTSVLLILRPPDYEPIAYIMGGNTPTTRKTAEQIDLSAPAPAWSALPDLNVPRPEQFTATLLPDGRVFIAGGVSGGADGGPCEIFDPRNPGAGWALGPNMKYVRTYHSSFILLTDGSILAGGDPQVGGGPTAHERFFPDYFDGLRPTITNAPATINYGTTFTINTPTPLDITEVALLRAGAVTHGYNMSQRGIECVIAGSGAGTLDVETPPNSNLAPPGWYLLFVLDSNRIPSEGRWVRLTP